MLFHNSYFEDEVRDGFFVPSEIKRAWAAELEVLSEIDKICKKYKIQYFADWGTLLATVRHEGFIPWDDDLDIVMKREDYRRFMEIAQTELPEGFSAYNFRNHDNLWLFLGRVVGKRRICFEEEHLERFHQFPYIAGVDIFVLDYDMPSYRFTPDQLNCIKDKNGYKNLMRDAFVNLQQMANEIETQFYVSGKAGELLLQMQQLVKDMGSLIENVKGEEPVSSLEQL